MQLCLLWMCIYVSGIELKHKMHDPYVPMLYD
jgi:hypothetical protein